MGDGERRHYLILCRLERQDRYLIWYPTDWDDGLVVDADGRLVSFSEAEAAREYASQHGFALEDDEPVSYDLDQIEESIYRRNGEVDCVRLLNYWNLFADVAASVPHESRFRSLDRAEPRIYDKIFFGNNLSAITPPGKSYEPVWSDYEVEHIAAVMSSGLQLLRESLQ